MSAAEESAMSSRAERPGTHSPALEPLQVHGPTSVGTAGLAVETSLRLPATDIPPAATPESPAIARLEALVVAAVVLLAFLLAFFPARNSDLWMHLAAGRSLAHGTYSFGENPFTPQSEGSRWVNHSWLYDLMSYGVYRISGGNGLIVLKALLVVAG